MTEPLKTDAGAVEAGRAAWKAAATPLRKLGALFLIPGMALLAYVNFMTHERSPILSMVAAILMLIGAGITFAGFAKGDKARKAALAAQSTTGGA